jgi:hypothetical protein
MTEVQINVWGPLQQEYILEQTLELARLLRTPEREDPAAGFPDPVIPGRAPTDVLQAPIAPEDTPDAGAIVAQPPTEVERFGFVRATFLGGDPVIDSPRVALERRQGDDWVAVIGGDGRPLDDAGYEIVLTYRPDPSRGAQRQHRYTAHFEVVSDEPDLDAAPGFALGTYRFCIDGTAAAAEDTGYPFTGRAYTATTEPFTVVAASALEVAVTDVTGGVISGRVAYPAAGGFRLRDAAADPETGSPVHTGKITAVISNLDIGVEFVSDFPIDSDGAFALRFTGPPPGHYRVALTAEDRWSNRGAHELETDL